MKYLYYPGCSLRSTGRCYEESLLAVFEVLGVPLQELDDWNCCGATAYMAIDESRAFALAARNLALAERQNGNGADAQLMAPCSACYLVLCKAQRYMTEYSDVRQHIGSGLEAAGLSYSGTTRVRHPLDVLLNDIGLAAVESKIKRPFNGLKVACYYGCQVVRPFANFDDQNNPVSMDRLVHATGAEPVDWALKTRCCGGALTGTIPDVGLRLNQILLTEARRQGADVVATCCPLCQFNLECLQNRMTEESGEKISLPVVYFTQLLGIALGLPAKQLGLDRLFVPFEPSWTQPKEVEHVCV